MGSPEVRRLGGRRNVRVSEQRFRLRRVHLKWGRGLLFFRGFIPDTWERAEGLGQWEPRGAEGPSVILMEKKDPNFRGGGCQ